MLRCVMSKITNVTGDVRYRRARQLARKASKDGQTDRQTKRKNQTERTACPRTPGCDGLLARPVREGVHAEFFEGEFCVL